MVIDFHDVEHSNAVHCEQINKVNRKIMLT